MVSSVIPRSRIITILTDPRKSNSGVPQKRKLLLSQEAAGTLFALTKAAEFGTGAIKCPSESASLYQNFNLSRSVSHLAIQVKLRDRTWDTSMLMQMEKAIL